MKCHYEVLGVSRTADGDELKKAYRKLALQWHPDKNLDNIEEATVQFRTIQQAYAVLADPQERAFYDKYRDSILRAGEGKADDQLDLFGYFNCSCYSGHNDGENGFYTVYRNLFEKLAEEDADYRSEPRNEDEVIPTFGCSDSSYDDVVRAFYAYWQSYGSKSSYAWLYKYNIRDATNRKEARLIEKDNKKIRDQARKKRNEEVQALVAFVKKRDKRVQRHRKLLEEQSVESSRKVEENRRKQLVERKKLMDNYQESNWAAISQIEEILQEMESNIAKEFGEGELVDDDVNEQLNTPVTELYCIACDKAFKSEKAFENHENSKKHKENCAVLKEIVLQEELELSENEITNLTGNESIKENETDESVIADDLLYNDHNSKRKKRKSKKKKLLTSVKSVSDEEEQSTSASATYTEISNLIEENKIEEKLVQNSTPNEINAVDEIANSAAECTDAVKNIKIKSQEKSTSSKSTFSKSKSKSKAKDESNMCATCNCIFASRNKLFDHLKSTGHSRVLNKEVNVKPIKKKR